MAAIGSCWAANTWNVDAWAADTWKDGSAPIPPTSSAGIIDRRRRR